MQLLQVGDTVQAYFWSQTNFTAETLTKSDFRTKFLQIPDDLLRFQRCQAAETLHERFSSRAFISAALDGTWKPGCTYTLRQVNTFSVNRQMH